LPAKYPPKIKAEAIAQMKEGVTDTEISKSLGMSTRCLSNWRKQAGLSPSSGGRKRYTIEQLNDVVDLIRDGYPIGEISKETGVAATKIREWHQEEIRKGNPLPNIKKGVGISQKYSDEELIELAYLNPGYGVKRFISTLGISEKFLLELFLEYKHYTNGEDDLIAILQDERYGEMISHQEYYKLTGNKYAPKGSGLSTNRSSRGSDANKGVKSIFHPPQEFNWGEYNRKYWRSSISGEPLEWIKQKLSDKGYITAREDKDDFILDTGTGVTKFNNWMKRADLIFDRKSGHWIKR